VTEQDLRSLFLPYGTIHSIHIPQSASVPVTHSTSGEDVKPEEEEVKMPATRGKGFAFVWMWTKKEAERAMEGVNGTKVHAGMAEEMVKDKQRRKKARREAKKSKDEKKGNDEEEAKDVRIIAVDWALSKDKWEEEKQKMEVDEETEPNEGGEDALKSEDDGETSSEDNIGLHDDSGSDKDEDSDVDERSDIEEKTKPQLPAPESGTTVFVRNIPFEATEDELRTL
jgi:nucleolar protein 4